MIFHYPSLSQRDFLIFRLRGAGLANHLFPMYRAFQKSKETGGVFLFPPSDGGALFDLSSFKIS